MYSSSSPINRQRNDVNLDSAIGLYGRSVVHKFGLNPSLGASSTEPITFGGVINWLQAATAVRVKAGGSASDDTAGSGAQSITIMGLDETWAEAEETIATAGASASSATSVTFIRIFRAYVKNAGTYAGTIGANVANVVIENSAGGTDLITIGLGQGQTQTTAYTVPLGKTAYLTRIAATVDAAKAVDMRMWQRQDADDVSTPFRSARLVLEFPQLIGRAADEFNSYPSFPAKTDLWWTGTTSSGAAAAIAADYCLCLVDT